jgi:hypothetical protein
LIRRPRPDSVICFNGPEESDDRTLSERTPHEVAAESVVVILADDQTAQILRDVLEDASSALSNETEMYLGNLQSALVIGLARRGCSGTEAAQRFNIERARSGRLNECGHDSGDESH